MITRFTAENYGCLKQVEVALTPLHAFIGPNDSGKSTLLRGIRPLVQLADGAFSGPPDKLSPFDPVLPIATSIPTRQETALSCSWKAARTGCEQCRTNSRMVCPSPTQHRIRRTGT